MRPTEESQKRLLPLGVAGLTLVAALLSTVACSPPLPPHPGVGKWRNGILSLSVYPDRIASINGVQCDWAPIDGISLRISPRTKVELPDSGSTIEFAFEMRVLEGGQEARLDLFGFPITIEREDEAQPASSKPVY